MVGLEPTCSCLQWILNPSRLPFRHIGVSEKYYTLFFVINQEKRVLYFVFIYSCVIIASIHKRKFKLGEDMKEKDTLPFVSAILVAAGNGKRMLGISKQLHPLNGVPVIAHTIQIFLECSPIKEIILVCREDEKEIMDDIAEKYIIGLPYTVVCGGNQRQDSVFCGINATSKESEFFAIHDGVRPLVRTDDIEKCVELAEKVGAATLGVKVKDTIKVVNEEGIIVSTPDRASLYSIQTPQVFEAELYQKAMYKALAEEKQYTDDCQLIENMGRKVSVCPGSYENIKITTREDIYIAEAILNSRKEHKL